MAADTLKYYKRAFGSGETRFEVRVGADNDTNTSKTEQPEVLKLTVNKDIYDGLHADTITALGNLTVAALIAKAYGAS